MSRLACPGCGVAYIVPDDVLGPEGRRVSCEACGTVWHAPPPETRAPVAGAATENAPTEGASIESAAVADAPGAEDRSGEDRAGSTDAAPASTPPAPAPAPPLEPELESTAESKANSLFSPPPQTAADETFADDGAVARRFAEIRRLADEINRQPHGGPESRDRSAIPGAIPAKARRGGGGLTAGFLPALVLGAAMTSLYVFAPQIGDRIPEAGPLLDNYRAGLDEAAAAVRGVVESAVESVMEVVRPASSEG